VWRWTPDGQYTMQSAYRIQFMGRRKKPYLTPIWKAKVEPKCRSLPGSSFSIKSSLQITLPNADGRTIQFAHCEKQRQKHPHLCMECPCTQNVWTHLTSQLGRQVHSIPPTSHNIGIWWRRMRRALDKNKNLNSMESCCISGGTSGRNITAGFFITAPCR
jgi:hypothetical protein